MKLNIPTLRLPRLNTRFEGDNFAGDETINRSLSFQWPKAGVPGQTTLKDVSIVARKWIRRTEYDSRLTR